jgi:predicted RNA binding protein YcfA (HicA-like mRNA interferase family)
MPRKIRQLKSDLRKAGFIEQRDRGKGSHVRWYHPSAPEIIVNLAGQDGEDAKAYQELDVRKAISRVTQANE